MVEPHIKYGIKLSKIWKGDWCFGIFFVHETYNCSQTFLCINLFKVSILIGKIEV